MFGKRGNVMGNGSGDPPDSPRLSKALRTLDPSTRDPAYWMRFQRRVMDTVAGELRRRRRIVELTVSDVVISWSRTLVPAAMLAAAVAAFLLLRPLAPAPIPVGVDELLAEGIGVPTPLLQEAPDDAISFAAEGF